MCVGSGTTKTKKNKKKDSIAAVMVGHRSLVLAGVAAATLASSSTAAAAAAAAATSANAKGAPFAPFRAPAIPLLTTDPFTQTWVRGDTSTSTGVTHWDGAPKTTTVAIRVKDSHASDRRSNGGRGSDSDGQVYQLLGSCVPVEPSTPGPAQELGKGHDVSPGSNDIANYPNMDADECNRMCYGTQGCMSYVMRSGIDARCFLKSAAGPVVAADGSHDPYIIDPSQRVCQGSVVHATQKAVRIYPTRTVFELEVGNASACICRRFHACVFGFS